jgi:catechol 2,3-dioxygenase-like lactoylglutathione lyase family enzyme
MTKGERMLGRISYITLWVNEYDACLAFYRDMLELPLDTADENFAQFVTEGTKLYLHRLGTNSPLRAHALEIHFEVPDADAEYNSLLGRGAQIEQPPANMPWGTRIVRFGILREMQSRLSALSIRRKL